MTERIADSFYKTATSATFTSGSGSKEAPRPGEPAHLVALRDAFPGIWVCEDGAFLYDEFQISWRPGLVEYSGLEESSMAGEPCDGLCRIRGGDYGRGTAKLKLSQLVALTNYIKAEAERPRHD